MLSTFILIIAVLASSTATAHPDATPSARVRTTSRQTTDTLLYSYAYAVDDPEYRNFYDHEEARSGEITRGRFRVALPDNRLQTVTYRAGSKGYTAKVSYDHHPNFQALRSSVEPVGPIREGPAIGQPAVRGSRRGENWKNHGQQSENESSNNVEPTTTTILQRPTPTPTRPSRQRPRPFRTSPKPSTSRRPTTTKRPQRFRSSTRRPQITTTSRFRPSGQKGPSNNPPISSLVTSPRPQITTPASSPRPRPGQIPEQPALFVSTEGMEDSDILARLIEAIRLKVEAEGESTSSQGHHSSEEEDGSRKGKPRYTIKDRASVIARLNAIVHSVPISKV